MPCQQSQFLSVSVGDIKFARKKQHLNSMLKNLKLVDLGEPTSFLTTYFWDALNVNVNRTKLTLMITEKKFESRISAGAPEKYVSGKNLTQRRLRGPTTWKDMPKSALGDVANWRTKIQSSF